MRTHTDVVPDGSCTFDLEASQITPDGAAIFTVRLESDSERRTERSRSPQGDLVWGARYRSELAEPVTLTLRLDLAGLHAQAVRAARSKSGKSRNGSVTISGGKRARFRRVEGWGDEGGAA